MGRNYTDRIRRRGRRLAIDAQRACRYRPRARKAVRAEHDHSRGRVGRVDVGHRERIHERICAGSGKVLGNVEGKAPATVRLARGVTWPMPVPSPTFPVVAMTRSWAPSTVLPKLIAPPPVLCSVVAPASVDRAAIGLAQPVRDAPVGRGSATTSCHCQRAPAEIGPVRVAAPVPASMLPVTLTPLNVSVPVPPVTFGKPE